MEWIVEHFLGDYKCHTLRKCGDLILMSPIHGAGVERCAETRDVVCWKAAVNVGTSMWPSAIGCIYEASGLPVCSEEGLISQEDGKGHGWEMVTLVVGGM